MYIGVQKFFGVSQDFINPSENYGRVKADKTKITRATLSNKFEKYFYISGVLGAHGHKINQFFHYKQSIYTKCHDTIFNHFKIHKILNNIFYKI